MRPTFQESYQKWSDEGYAFDVDATESIHEGFGLSLKKEHYPKIKVMKIPQFVLVERLNVSVPASIVMYEFVRSRGFNPLKASL